MQLNSAQQAYIKSILNPFKFSLFTITSFPTMWFWGVKVKQLDAEVGKSTIKYSQRSRNPFKSLYFSALFGAAELSTGVLVQMYIQGEGNWSMLVKQASGEFTKKALGTITFSCTQGSIVQNEIQRIKKNGEGTFTLQSIGHNEQGVEIGRYNFEWTLKYKG